MFIGWILQLVIKHEQTTWVKHRRPIIVLSHQVLLAALCIQPDFLDKTGPGKDLTTAECFSDKFERKCRDSEMRRVAGRLWPLCCRIWPYLIPCSLVILIRETYIFIDKDIIFFLEKTYRELKEIVNVLGKLLDKGEKIHFVNE